MTVGGLDIKKIRTSALCQRSRQTVIKPQPHRVRRPNSSNAIGMLILPLQKMIYGSIRFSLAFGR